MDSKIVKNIAVIFSVAIGVLAVGYGVLWYLTRPLSAEGLVATTDQFQPDPSWELESENIQPPKRLCLSGKCNYIHKVWHTEGMPSRESLIESLERSGWPYELPENCTTGRNLDGVTPACDDEFVVDGYEVSVWTSYDANNNGVGSVVIKVQGEM